MITEKKKKTPFKKKQKKQKNTELHLLVSTRYYSEHSHKLTKEMRDEEPLFYRVFHPHTLRTFHWDTPSMSDVGGLIAGVYTNS